MHEVNKWESTVSETFGVVMNLCSTNFIDISYNKSLLLIRWMLKISS